MVNLTIAGGSGRVVREVIDALLATGKHEITVFSRKIHWHVVNYNDKNNLAEALRGTHTLLSFVQHLTDPEQQSQKSLIDAAIAVGVKRFAPSEYGSADTVDMPWWAGKEVIRSYLRKVNQNAKPGLLLDYLASPYKTAKHVDPLDTVFDFKNCRAILLDGHEDAIMTLTTVADHAAVIARAVDYEGEWPETGGIKGNRVPVGDIVKIGEAIRERPSAVENARIEDLEAGVLNTSWRLKKKHGAVSDEQAAELIKTVSIGMLLSSAKGAWDVLDDFNRLLPEYQYVRIQDLLARVWKGEP